MTATEESRECIAFEAAVAMLPDGDEIHTFRSLGAMLLGMDFDRQSIIEKLKSAPGIELAGPTSRSMDHGIVIHDEYGWLFIETRKAGVA